MFTLGESLVGFVDVSGGDILNECPVVRIYIKKHSTVGICKLFDHIHFPLFHPDLCHVMICPLPKALSSWRLPTSAGCWLSLGDSIKWWPSKLPARQTVPGYHLLKSACSHLAWWACLHHTLLSSSVWLLDKGWWLLWGTYIYILSLYLFHWSLNLYSTIFHYSREAIVMVGGNQENPWPSTGCSETHVHPLWK